MAWRDWHLAPPKPAHNAVRVRSWDGIRMTGTYYRPPFPPLRVFLERSGFDRIVNLSYAITALRRYWVEYVDDETALRQEMLLDNRNHPLLQEIYDLATE